MIIKDYSNANYQIDKELKKQFDDVVKKNKIPKNYPIKRAKK